MIYKEKKNKMPKTQNENEKKKKKLTFYIQHYNTRQVHDGLRIPVQDSEGPRIISGLIIAMRVNMSS